MQNFNPRSREGSDSLRSIYAAAAGISIHAPAKGATGGTVQEQLQSIQFQSTLPRRERRWDTEMLALELGISIHAPAKGATHDIICGIQSLDISIHAPAKGATAKITKTIPNDFAK